jgi:nucleotide-binding universal stress UspA family protein
LKKAGRKLVVGLPVTRTLEVVEQISPRLLVMGSAGRTGLSRILLGSKAEQLVRLCPVPVVIVKTPLERRPQAGEA